MKRVTGHSHQSYLVDEESGARFKQQRLLQEYLEVQKEFVSKKKTLQIAMQKKEILLAEVRFLKWRHKYLRKQCQKIEPQDLVGSLNSHPQNKLFAKTSDVGVSETVLKNPLSIVDLNPISGDEDCCKEKKGEVIFDQFRVGKKSQNWMINEKRVGKKKISWQDQVVLRV